MLPVRSEEPASQSSNTGLWAAGRRRKGKVPTAVTGTVPRREADLESEEAVSWLSHSSLRGHG